ncbi:hypothetical protein [Jeotgalibacillus haloalkalitolerans]|uniref:YcxB-like protein domain-containing protein n=1 Tax=Jeotgalibacillus haloalkalitolerans TaxID=3104292 RepID=A0ABU5KHB5_9BACL|nr:hypothetical protein [Jeotgalibacillus sp. HH7-29]MDZ5710648.1 hypothetical protein [Jeotgalibacillus sp. HH7-29]
MKEISINYFNTKKGCIQLMKHLPYNRFIFYFGCALFLMIGIFEFQKSAEVARRVADGNASEELILLVISVLIEGVRFLLSVAVIYFLGRLINRIKGNHLYNKHISSSTYPIHYREGDPFISIGEKRRRFPLDDKLTIVATQDYYLFYSGKPWKLDTFLINRDQESDPVYRSKLDKLIQLVIEQEGVNFKKRK